MKIKLFTNLKKRHNRNTTPNLVSGFTIVEALIAIFILTVSVSSMLGVTASSATSARYSNNEITANYLLQEAVDSIRNTRDTLAFQMRDDSGIGTGWDIFLNKYGSPGSMCFSTIGCDIRMENFSLTNLTGNDLILVNSLNYGALYYDKDGTSSFFYSHDSNLEKRGNFKRKIIMEKVGNNNDQIKVTVTLDWMNGNLSKSQSLVVYLLNWQK